VERGRGLNPQDTNSKLATYKFLFAVPFGHNVRAPGVRLLRHMHLDLSCHAQLLAVTIRVIWLVGFSVEDVLPILVQ
jgi:hypothetical protein